MPQIRLRQARGTDLTSIARVWTAAFFDDEVIGEVMHPKRKQYPDDVYWFLLRGIREHFWNWRHQFLVVTAEIPDEQGNAKEAIVGAADWRRLGTGGVTRELVWADPRNLIEPILHVYHRATLALFPNRAADPAQSSWLEDAVAASEQYWTQSRSECWDLHVCGVHPDFQGIGAGRLLAEWGVLQAAKEEAVASVLCGPKNREFYRKAGFAVEVGRGSNGLALFTK